MSRDSRTEPSQKRKRIIIEIMGDQEFVDTPDGTYKLASPIWERGMHEVEYVPQDQLATATRIFGERFKQDMIGWLQSTGHAGAQAATVGDGIAVAKRQAIEEVTADIRDGTVPGTVGSFSELHDYVDANGYGGALDWPEGAPRDESDEEFVLDTSAFWNAVQDGVDAWIKAGRPAPI